VDQLYNQGELYLKSEDWKSAEVAFRAALRLNPNHANTRWELGHALYEQEKIDEALEEMRKALQLGIKCGHDECRRWFESQSSFQRGRKAFAQNDWPRAETEFRESLKSDDYSSAHYNLGVALENEAKYVEAELEYGKAVHGYRAEGLDSDASDAQKRLERVSKLAREQEEAKEYPRKDAEAVVTIRQDISALAQELDKPPAGSSSSLDLPGRQKDYGGLGTAFGQAQESAEYGKLAVRAHSDRDSKDKSGTCFDNCPGQPSSPDVVDARGRTRGSASLSQATLEKMKKTPALKALLDNEDRAKIAADQTSARVRQKELALSNARTEAEKLRLQVDLSEARQAATNAKNNFYTSEIKVEKAAKVIEEVELVDPSKK
jgi:tetratricopeptide (TPR) repeat protein